jgi:hypothetical protein
VELPLYISWILQCTLKKGLFLEIGGRGDVEFSSNPIDIKPIYLNMIQNILKTIAWHRKKCIICFASG